MHKLVFSPVDKQHFESVSPRFTWRFHLTLVAHRELTDDISFYSQCGEENSGPWASFRGNTIVKAPSIPW